MFPVKRLSVDIPYLLAKFLNPFQQKAYGPIATSQITFIDTNKVY